MFCEPEQGRGAPPPAVQAAAWHPPKQSLGIGCYTPIGVFFSVVKHNRCEAA